MKGYDAGRYDVIVVGAGHAGCEAALAAARLGCQTLLLTLNLDNIALMPCNPAVGGPAKGHLVREIDALGGQMGLNTDKTLIQIRMLNTGKGPAVRALRAQADKKLYQLNMTEVLEGQSGLQVKQGIVEEIIVRGEAVAGVITRTGAFFRAAAVVVTTGTYLRGKIIIGEVNYSGGPNGQFASEGLARSLKDHGLALGRFKTGTPPRVDRRTVDFDKMSEQPGDEYPHCFSFMTGERVRPNIPCWLTFTSEKTHQIIRDNLHRSPLYSGMIEGVGPRYCPSIEDKVVRFADKPNHQIFLEPEGLNTYEMYVQGFSTSLPEDVQVEMLRSIPGLEQVEIMRVGYAIEYDYLDPQQLGLNMEAKHIQGLFSAGQINGTSGYEEAAAQGIMAGINAALKVKGVEPFILKRSEGYVGVLIDDLVTRGTNEPYRLMTSRAEYRLLLRHDNADLRLTEKGYRLGLATHERYQRMISKREAVENEIGRLESLFVKDSEERVQSLLISKGGSPFKGSISMRDLLRRPEISYQDIVRVFPGEVELNEEIGSQVEIQVKYQGYVEKQRCQVERFERMENRKLPGDLDYMVIKGLSKEAQEKLANVKPRSVGQASRISGVSPADISVLVVCLEKRKGEGEV